MTGQNTGNPEVEDTSGMSDGELLEYMGTDAVRWAQQFCERLPDVVARSKASDDPDLFGGWVLGWFANALWRGTLYETKPQEDQGVPHE